MLFSDNHPILQSIIIPICRINDKSKNMDFLYGTAFFTCVPGIFITANHVYQAMLDAQNKNPEHFYGLCVKGESGNLLVAIEKIESSPIGLDIAIGKVNFNSVSPIKLVKEKPFFLQDVLTIGYPENASEREKYNKQISHWCDLRAHKGIINREIFTKASELAMSKDLIELSFIVDRGISGAPLFVDNTNYLVTGVCLGARVIQEGILNESEKIPNYTQYGRACMTSSFSTWIPKFLTKEQHSLIFK